MPAAPNRRLTHDQRVLCLALLSGMPAVLVTLFLLWTGDYASKTQWTLMLMIGACWLGFAFAARERVIRPLQTMANLLAALREGDFSIRARGASHEDPLGDVLAEINLLSRILQQQRLNSLEATALLRTVMAEIDVAIFAFDGEGVLRLANPAGQELLAQPAERLLGRDATSLGLAAYLTGDDTRLLDHAAFPGKSGRWELRRTTFREKGRPHTLLVIADLSQALREEELQAWQRLVRVLGHELNNSLAPIKSLAGSLETLLRHPKRPPDWEADMHHGLEIIASRADSLSRFMQAYARLARLPQPTRVPSSLAPLVQRAASLESRLPVRVDGGPDLTLHCDSAQIEQVLINLLKNAVDAALERRALGHTKAGARIVWRTTEHSVEIDIEDDGLGIANSGNLFVPFFTTKPEGSGIGLVLCRQIAENHGGSLQLLNRPDGAPGCLATLRLPRTTA